LYQYVAVRKIIRYLQERYRLDILLNEVAHEVSV